MAVQLQDQHKTIRDISQSAINMLVGDRTVLDVIGAERANIELQGQELMDPLYESYGLGIRVTTVKLQNIVPPKGAVQDAFEDVNKAIQDRRRMINEGKEAYNQSIPRASGQADQTIQEAQGSATERVDPARGDVLRYLAVLGEYRQAPDVVRTRLCYEMYDHGVRKRDGTDLVDRNLKLHSAEEHGEHAPPRRRDERRLVRSHQRRLPHCRATRGAGRLKLKKTVLIIVLVGVLLLIASLLGPYSSSPRVSRRSWCNSAGSCVRRRRQD